MRGERRSPEKSCGSCRLLIADSSRVLQHPPVTTSHCVINHFVTRGLYDSESPV